MGAVLFDLAKKFIFEFHYVRVKPKFNLESLYSDTDSVIHVIKSEDVYKDLKGLGNHFDFSNYLKVSPMYSDINEKTVLNLKDAMAGKIIEEFIGLKPKLYSLRTKI